MPFPGRRGDGLADHELGLEDDLTVLVIAVGGRRLLEQHPRGGVAELLPRLPH
jgi:hypothetical protein